MKKIHFKKLLQSLFIFLFVFSWIFSGFFSNIQEARAATVAIRQEINIIDVYFGSPNGAYATSSAIIQIDTDAYNGATYYFEVVASTTSATPATIALQNATSGVVNAAVTVNGTSYDLYRSDPFTPNMSGQADYVVVMGSEGVQKGAIAARVVILQSADPITNTQTHIEIGSATTTARNITTLPLQYPKYWYYDSTKWDGSPTFSAEVTYKDYQVASSTLYTTPGTFTYKESRGVSYIQIEAWGGGGGGGAEATNAGGGGGGGAYVRSTTTPIGSDHALVVAAIGPSDTATARNSSYDAGQAFEVVAEGGTGSSGNGVGAGGNTTVSVGQIENIGGTGGAKHNTDASGGGGGSAGPGGDGTVGGAAGSSVGGGGGNANGVAGQQANGGSGTCGSTGDGGVGTSAVTGGNGGGGSDGGCTGVGTGGDPGGGGGGIDTDTAGANTGGRGQINLIETHGKVGIALEQDDGVFGTWTNIAQIITDGTATSSPARVRVSFTPTDGKHYRIVASTTASTASYDIYNAKIVVDQTSPTLLEPQYLLANTKLASGINLQNFLTSWNSAEWSGVTNTYIHQVDSADGSGSVVEVDNAPAGTQVSGSEVSSPDNSATSSAMTMPADGDLDVKATTNNNDIYASRILVQVAPTLNPVIEQRVYRWREDDGNEINASWATAENIELSSGIFIGDRRRLRFLISNSTASADSIAYRLEYASSSSCTISIPVPAVASSEEWAMDPSYYLSEDNSTTDVSGGLTNPGGKTFFAGYVKNASNQTNAHSLTSSQFTEHEYAIKSTTNAQTGLSYCFRLTNAGSTTNFVYTINASTTLSAAARPQAGGGGGESSGGGSAQTGATEYSGGAGAEESGGGAPIGGGTGQGGGGDSEE